MAARVGFKAAIFWTQGTEPSHHAPQIKVYISEKQQFPNIKSTDKTTPALILTHCILLLPKDSLVFSSLQTKF